MKSKQVFLIEMLHGGPHLYLSRTAMDTFVDNEDWLVICQFCTERTNGIVLAEVDDFGRDFLNEFERIF
jgi:hypothetical protein